MPRRVSGAAVLLAFLVVVRPAAAEPLPGSLEYFEGKVRPILTARCYACHSVRAKKLRGQLLLDRKAGWERGGDSGPAIIPGHPERSLLVQAVTFEDPDLRMPPQGRLPGDEVRILVDWVKAGAFDPRTSPALPGSNPSRAIDLQAGKSFWSFRPLGAVTPPEVDDGAWCRTPIDRFVLARLDAAKLRANPEAGRRLLIRRLAFDLTGLPSSVGEVEAFVRDDTPQAYERLVDRLLASPHYGERWGRHWLDLARFAESHGFEHDTDRPTAYPYRDFVIEALNRDLPFDTFVRWQLAGDELQPSDPLALKATGFLAAGVHSTQITANQVEKERYDELDDMASTIGTAMLGLTIGCARCHDHKYDPIPQRDYYRLLATFTTTVRSEVDLELDPEGDAQARIRFEQAHAPYVDALARFEREQLPSRLEAWERQRAASAVPTPPCWVVLDVIDPRSEAGATFTKLDDGSCRVSGKNAAHDVYTLQADVEAGTIAAIRLEAMADPSLVKGGPGRAANGNFDLTDFRLEVRSRDSAAPPVAISWKNAIADFEQPGLPVKAAIDADGKSGWAIDPQFGKNHVAIFEPRGTEGIQDAARLTFTLSFRGNTQHNLGRFRLAVSSANELRDFRAPSIPQVVRKAIDSSRDERTPEQWSALLAWYRTRDPAWLELKQKADDHAALAPRPTTIKALISTEGLPAVRLHTQGGDFLKQTHFLKRGDPNQKQGEATPGFLQVLMATPDAETRWHLTPPAGSRTSFRRAALADWITDVEHGAGSLLARVIVNRLWQHHFGRGIVATPSDFGTQGERPTHPELLDWLAGELIRSGWRLKAIHRAIVTSAVYRQSAELDPVKDRVDPDNTTLWRQSRRRLEAEALRDAMLAVAGELDPRMFGPGTLVETQKRRSVYFTVKRSRLIPMMLLFDAPDALQGVAVRPSTTIAPQSLLLMNNPTVRSWSTGFAVRTGASNTLEERLRRAYAIALGRFPDPVELADSLAFVEGQEARYRERGEAESRLLALTDLCQVLMSLNEFAYVE